MFLETQVDKKIDKYKKYLKAVGSFSNLYSSSLKPFIQYRVAENIFCKAFDAENLARSDVAYDAIINGFGIGIKTFTLTGNSKIEKVAEFNSYSAELRQLRGINLANRLADYRNERIEFADRLYNIQNRVYHIVGRDDFKIKIFEVGYDLIEKDSIEIIQESKSSLKFRDAKNEYNFNYSKSVLMKRFSIPEKYIEIGVEIIEEPLDVLLSLIKPDLKVITKKTDDVELLSKIGLTSEEELTPGKDFVILPLYSPNAKKNLREPIVPLKCQLNQWNAGGRKRDPGEVYIFIPKKIHNIAPDFFPNRHVPFNLKIPSGEILNAKVCQDNNKGLMTNPNNAMANWMLRKVLNLAERNILTYDHLRSVGYDSVKITKVNDNEFLIDFTPLNEYEDFIEKIIQ